MARPVEFEYDFVLSNAMKQFWKEGFEASSIQKLLDATNINRGTLYNSFGDKDAFFKACVDTYNTAIKADLQSTLGNKDLKPVQAIEAYFDLAVISASNKQRSLGCLLVNSVCESINWDKDTQKVLRNSLNTIRKALLGRTKELEKAKKLKKGLNADLAADLLMNTLHGLRVNSRNGKVAKQMADIISFAIASIKK
jgi:TetR/AcrR family transcriptional regulator, transcriptional repressor for nem operon